MQRINLSLLLTLLLVACPLQADEFQIKKIDAGVEVQLDGKLLTRYLVKSGAKPILWPLIGPHGNEITRAYPMAEGVEDERADHPHHRSFWFTHGMSMGSISGVRPRATARSCIASSARLPGVRKL